MDIRCKVMARFFAAALFGFFLSSWSTGTQEELLTPLSEIPIAVKGDEIGDMLRKWYSHGTAAGNVGDYYDNRDGGHSRLNLGPYPQLQKIEYSEEQIKTRQNWGMQRRVLPYVVFGNSSTSASPEQGGSNVRTYYTDPGGLAFLFAQYVSNNLYIYPEHRDYDPGHNGAGGYGDLFPTNTPYLIASQGSSGSDQPFMQALPYVLAAFQPEVKRKLIQSGMLMPTIQMILRITNRHLASSKEYLTGKAHPTVFRGSDVNTRAMVEMAHGISLSNMPPIALIRTVKEDTPVNDVGYFEPELSEKLADTPAVIARVFRGPNYLRKIVVSAEQSRDLNKRPLKFYWAVLRGDSSRIKIEYHNPSRSVAEITVPYHDRSPIAEDSSLESNRVDIGVFVHNGAYYSPPAFITFYTLDSEARTYGMDGQPLEIGYGVGTSTISVADWKAFFDALQRNSEAWQCKFLRKQFKTEELGALIKVSEEFYKIHEWFLSAQEMKEKADAALKIADQAVKTLQTKQGIAEKSNNDKQSEETKAILAALSEELQAALKAREKSAGDLVAARKAFNDAQQSEKQALQKKMQRQDFGAAELVQRVLNSVLQDPNLWSANADDIKPLYESAGSQPREALNRIRERLIHFGFADNSAGGSFNLTPIRKGDAPLAERLTLYEKGMIGRLNAIVLSSIMFPGIIDSGWRENYVDFRIASAKDWRDVYRYAPDGTPIGFRRYQADKIVEFNAEGLLIVDKDMQGRCIRARVVRYELEPRKKDANGRPIEPFLRKVKLVETDALREYEYAGVNDWKGHIKVR